ncbi:MAG: DUF2800 domain-containing protein, partial [Chloroflexi bacterium]|nr:DUF2800 domain-containing protein [Chloroflexota bacterium]
DLTAWDDWGLDQLVIVLDWKSGWNLRRKGADKSVQLADYAIGALRAYPQARGVRVVQIELDQERWTDAVYSVEQLADWKLYLEDLIARAKAAKPGQYVAGDACKYCLRAKRGTCPALRPLIEQAAQDDSAPEPGTLESMDGKAIAHYLQWWTAVSISVEKNLNALQAEAKRRLGLDPKGVPGWRIYQRAGRRSWADSDEKILASLRSFLANHGGSDAGAPSLTTLVTPADAEKRLIAFLGKDKASKEKAAKAIAPLVTQGVSTVLEKES